MMEVLGERSYLRRGSPDSLLGGHIETLYRSLLILTFGVGYEVFVPVRTASSLPPPPATVTVEAGDRDPVTGATSVTPGCSTSKVKQS